MDRIAAHASRTWNKSERNYPAHKLDILALKWAVMDCFHECLYGGTFDVFTDNNPLTHILTSAKLDAIGKYWVANLANYNFQHPYKSGKSNVEADVLSCIPWDRQSSDDVFLDCDAVKAIIVGCSLETLLFEAYKGSPIHTKSLHITTIADTLISALSLKTKVIQPPKITHEQWAEEQNVRYPYC